MPTLLFFFIDILYSHKETYANKYLGGGIMNNNNKIEKAVKFLRENPVQYLATVGIDEKAKCRPFMFLLEKEGKLFFCTNNKKNVYKQMEKNPYIEICTSAKDFTWIRISGKAVFTKDIKIKEECVSIPMIKNIYKSADNPIFEVFSIENAEIKILDVIGTIKEELSL